MAILDSGIEWIEDLLRLDTQIGAEDTALMEAVQQGSVSGMIERGWVLGGAESLIGHFQDWVRSQLELDQAAGLPVEGRS